MRWEPQPQPHLPTCLDMWPLKRTLIGALISFFRNGKAGASQQPVVIVDTG
ncbi:hypothetical protein LEMLEM_LOCUS16865 [Lemmus lemmus]